MRKYRWNLDSLLFVKNFGIVMEVSLWGNVYVKLNGYWVIVFGGYDVVGGVLDSVCERESIIVIIENYNERWVYYLFF